jgi:hypothetical protein
MNLALSCDSSLCVADDERAAIPAILDSEGFIDQRALVGNFLLNVEFLAAEFSQTTEEDRPEPDMPQAVLDRLKPDALALKYGAQPECSSRIRMTPLGLPAAF